MKINLKKTFTEYNGDPLVKTEYNEKTKKSEEIPITLLDFLSTIVSGSLPNEAPTAEDLAQRDQIARKLYASKEPDLTNKERTYITERLPKIYTSPRVYGLIIRELHPEDYTDEEVNHKEEKATKVAVAN